MKVAEAIIRALEEENVEYVFGYPGGAMLPVYDALHTSSLKHILVRHEQGATHAAYGYAKATGRVGVCMATSGPGATNLVTGIANAYMDSIPLVVFTGQVPTTQVGTDSFQEVDTTGITMPIVKHSYLANKPAAVLNTVKQAFHLACSGRPGPVLIDLPRDVAESNIDYNYPEKVDLPGYKPTYKGHPNQITQAAKIIKEANRPLIYAGGGILASRAIEELQELAEKISAPVVNTLMGLSSFPSDHPLYLGMSGMHGTRFANMAVHNCDLLIALGVRFNDRVTGRRDTYAPHARIIHIDIDPAEIGKNVNAFLPIVGNVKEVLKELIPLLQKKQVEAWLKQVDEWKQSYPLKYSGGKGLHPQYIIENLCQLTGGRAVVVTDVGQHQMWAAQYFRFKAVNSFITSGGLGCMGFGLPASIGAQLGLPDRKVLLIAGDGGFQMTMSELGTMVEQKLPVKMFILNNCSLGMVRQLQKFYCDRRYTAVDFKFTPDFSRLAEVYGIKGYNIESRAELDAILPSVLEADEPVLVNCFISAEEDVLPMVPSGSSLTEAID